jgi:carbonic anhydrase
MMNETHEKGFPYSATILAALAFALMFGCIGGGGEHSGAHEDHPAEESDEAHAIHWGYGREDGPMHWGGMNAAWATCDTGDAQSPIDIRDVKSSQDVDSLVLDLPEARLRIVRQENVLGVLDNGHTIQVNVDAGDTLTIGDQSFDLLQYHFHSPSEHTVNGEHYPMEMHLVHRSTAGSLAVVGVLIEEGEHNAAFDTVWSNMPTEAGTTVHLEHVSVSIDDMLPSDRTHWRYHGSLTTPPCSEGVRWFVLKTPIQLDAKQIQQFRDVFTGNNRPTQAVNGRDIIEVGPSAS